MEKWQLLESVVKFRKERLARIRQPAPLAKPLEGGLIILHMVPEESIEDRATFHDGVLHVGKRQLKRLPLESLHRPDQSVYNIDGKIVPFIYELESRLEGYVQLFFDGTVESVTAFRPVEFLPTEELDLSLSEVIRDYLEIQQSIGVKPPIMLMLSIAGPKDLAADSTVTVKAKLELPPHKLHSYDEYSEDSGGKVLKPILDRMWAATGREGSPSYKNGKFNPTK